MLIYLNQGTKVTNALNLNTSYVNVNPAYNN